MFNSRWLIKLKRTLSWKYINSMVSAPALCYLFLFLISVIFIGVSGSAMKGEYLKHVFDTLGYGLLCSTFVAALVDYGTTKRLKDKDNPEYVSRTRELRRNIDELLRLRLNFGKYVLEEHLEDIYIEWCLYLNDVNEEDFPYKQYIFKDRHVEEVKVTLQQLFIENCEMILSSARNIEHFSYILKDNSFFDRDFFWDLEHLIWIVEDIVKCKDYNSESYKTDVNNMFKNICEMFPFYRKAFYDKWQENAIKKRYFWR